MRDIYVIAISLLGGAPRIQTELISWVQTRRPLLAVPRPIWGAAYENRTRVLRETTEEDKPLPQRGTDVRRLPQHHHSRWRLVETRAFFLSFLGPATGVEPATP